MRPAFATALLGVLLLASLREAIATRKLLVSPRYNRGRQQPTDYLASVVQLGRPVRVSPMYRPLI